MRRIVLLLKRKYEIRLSYLFKKTCLFEQYTTFFFGYLDISIKKNEIIALVKQSKNLLTREIISAEFRNRSETGESKK